MTTSDREWITRVGRVVIKIGSRALLDDDNHIDEGRLKSLVRQVAALRQEGRDVVCVSSGAIAAGLAELELSTRPDDLPSLQASAAIGQARIMELYRRFFAEHGISVAQVLLTHADLRSRERHLNARNTLGRLLRGGIVPIVNENDTVAVDEIRVGDNDLLSALVTSLLQADVLILLTVADGLLTRPPGEGGELIPLVERVTEETMNLAGGASDLGTGGMRTKLEAAEQVTRCGEYAIIANATEPDIIGRLFRGEMLGTVFLPREGRLAGRKRWIAFFNHPRGELHVDAGATRALCEEGRSLLAVGVTAVHGVFRRGQPVRIIDPAGTEIARGLANYHAEQVSRIQGRPSGEFARILGRCEYEEVVHRDNLVLS